MRSVKPVAFILAVVILMPMLMSCRSGNKSSSVVKADDPWYETTKFEMKKDIRQYEKVKEAEICTSDDKVFSIYPLSRDMWGSARTVLDTYDFEGNLINRKELKCPDGMIKYRVNKIVCENKTLTFTMLKLSSNEETIVTMGIAPEGFTTDFLKDFLTQQVSVLPSFWSPKVATAQSASEWICPCGAKNSGNFCSQCGHPRE